MFQHYISLGENCEVAFQFRRVLQLDHSSFFSWNVTRIAALTSLLSNNFSDILKAENLRYEGNGTLVRDLSHDYHFHWIGDNFEEIKKESSSSLKLQREKSKHLIEKFREMISNDQSKALFYATDEVDIYPKIKVINDTLIHHFSANNFKIIVVQDRKFLGPEWKHNTLANRYVSRRAPWADATDGHVKSWDTIFQEFPHREGLTLSGY
jgi:Putative papain-like cysteine peptidase (DUF1796)